MNALTTAVRLTGSLTAVRKTPKRKAPHMRAESVQSSRFSQECDDVVITTQGTVGRCRN